MISNTEQCRQIAKEKEREKKQPINELETQTKKGFGPCRLTTQPKHM